MNSILFLGYSNFLKTRILPIIKLVNIQSVSIAKFSEQSWDDDLKKYNYPFRLYDNYEDAINQFQGNIVYVSTVNSVHYKYALMGLEKGFHVIIDKPATVRLEEAAHLIKVAKQKNLLMGEATVYLMHPQFALIDKIFIKNGDSPKIVTACFSMPPLNNDNFRYKKELGGGAILDTASYAVSLGRYFFKELPLQVQCAVNERNDNRLDIAYSLMMTYGNGKCLIGYFGFNTEYINQLAVLGTRTNISCNRVFTIPEHQENVINVTHKNKFSEERSKAGNNYQIYLEKYLESLDTGNYEDFYVDLMLDAQTKEMIINTIL